MKNDPDYVDRLTGKLDKLSMKEKRNLKRICLINQINEDKVKDIIHSLDSERLEILLEWQREWEDSNAKNNTDSIGHGKTNL
jgi:hypothetical protein